MTRPTRYLFTMAAFTAIVGGGGVLILPQLEWAFRANPILNGIILGVLVIGIVHAFRAVTILGSGASWIEDFRRSAEGSGAPASAPPRIMAAAATMLGERSGRTGQLNLSATAMQTVLDGVSTRLDEARESSRYMVGLLVFLGLLGTFWGLMETIKSVGGVIAGLEVGGEEIAGAFEDLRLGLQAPLEGMGTAFSSSLFGLAGSLVLGFMALQIGQAQNRFYNDLEEWLSGMTRLSGGGAVGDGDQSVPAYIQALLEQTADSLEALQRTLARGEEDRQQSTAGINSLNDKIAALADSMKVEQDLMLKLAESQQQLHPVLSKLADGKGSGGGGMDDASRAHLRNIDSHLNRLLEDQAKGRRESIQEVRNEIRLLARTIAAIAEGEG